MNNIFDVIVRRAQEAPDRNAVHFEDGSRWTYRELAQLSARWGRHLREDLSRLDMGQSQRQPRALVYLQNSPELVITLLGLWQAEITAVPINIMYHEDELRHVMSLTKPDIAITTQESAKVLRRASPGLPILTDIDADPVSACEVELDDPSGDGHSGDALVLMTSGSTGRPKALTISHSGFLQSIGNMASAHSSRVNKGGLPGLADEDVPPNLIYWPLFHAGGINALMFAWFVGRCVIIMERFRAERVAHLTGEFGVDNLFLLPTMMYDLVDLPDEYSLPTVRAVLASGQELQPAIRTVFEKRFGIPILANYGSTEVGHVAGWTIADVRAGAWKPGSTGKIYDGVEVQVRGENDEILGPDETGEIWVKTDITSGYVNAEQQGGELGDLIKDGWVRTRDVGHIDGDGVLFLRGRARDMIKCGGFQVWPSEVEEALLRHDAVKEVVVRKISDPRLGEAPLAAIVLSDESQLADDEGNACRDDIITHCRSILAHYKVPRQIVFVDAIPRTDAGKVDRPALDRKLPGSENAQELGQVS